MTTCCNMEKRADICSIFLATNTFSQQNLGAFFGQNCMEALIALCQIEI